MCPVLEEGHNQYDILSVAIQLKKLKRYRLTLGLSSKVKFLQ